MDHEAFARRVLGMAAADADEDRRPASGGELVAASARPCVECGEATTAVFFDAVTLLPEPPRCEACREEYLGGLRFSPVAADSEPTGQAANPAMDHDERGTGAGELDEMGP